MNRSLLLFHGGHSNVEIDLNYAEEQTRAVESNSAVAVLRRRIETVVELFCVCFVAALAHWNVF